MTNYTKIYKQCSRKLLRNFKRRLSLTRSRIAYTAFIFRIGELNLL
jgi:hypothetical protein